MDAEFEAEQLRVMTTAPTARKNVTLSKATIRYLEDIAKTGTHGYDVTAVIRSLVEQGVRHAIRDKLIGTRKISK